MKNLRIAVLVGLLSVTGVVYGQSDERKALEHVLHDVAVALSAPDADAATRHKIAVAVRQVGADLIGREQQPENNVAPDQKPGNSNDPYIVLGVVGVGVMLMALSIFFVRRLHAQAAMKVPLQQ